MDPHQLIDTQAGELVQVVLRLVQDDTRQVQGTIGGCPTTDEDGYQFRIAQRFGSAGQ